MSARDVLFVVAGANAVVILLALREVRKLRNARRGFEQLRDAYNGMVDAVGLLERASVGVVLLEDIHNGERSS